MQSRFPRFHGQTLIFETVLLFAIAIGIFTVLLAVFNIHQTHYNIVAINDQLKTINTQITTNILELAEKPGNGSIKTNIPTRIGDEFYKIELTQNGLNVSTLDRGYFVFSNIYNINESFKLSGRVVSTAGQIVINKNGDKINII